MKYLRKSLIPLCCLGALCVTAGTASAATVTDTAVFTFVVGDAPYTGTGSANEWNTGHGDIGVGYEGGELELHYHFEDGLNGSAPNSDLELEPGEAYMRASSATRNVTTGDIPFLGTQTGDFVWVLPQSNTMGIPFVGLAAEELTNPPITSDVTLSLTGFSGPGEFALYQGDGLGGVNVFMSTALDGVDPVDDQVTFPIGGHDHFNYGFTAEGVYQVEFTASATAVPEPGSFAALASLGACGAYIRRRRKAKSGVAQA
ncbi:choice-of-anchor M domain-containing protein [Crateriforma conspicua]|uniref:choice-of-anchor M domain-containing protein n=1 Tax=Crateriforma conspicua TaxID=2527996 RepID=UPI0011897D6C|nr:choice-of-anchor M domain-containing protein [Crateriforma conspicua]QDV62395.1 hypothetical protein Mal65_15290 [Crateriforma conspicua]